MSPPRNGGGWSKVNAVTPLRPAEEWHSPRMTKADETRLRNLKAKQAADKKLSTYDLNIMQKLEQKKRAETATERTTGAKNIPAIAENQRR